MDFRNFLHQERPISTELKLLPLIKYSITCREPEFELNKSVSSHLTRVKGHTSLAFYRRMDKSILKIQITTRKSKLHLWMDIKADKKTTSLYLVLGQTKVLELDS